MAKKGSSKTQKLNGEADPVQRAELFIRLARSQLNLGDWEKSAEYCYRALVENERADNKAGMAMCYANIAELYLRRGRHEKAEEVLQNAIALAEAGRAPEQSLVALGLLGEASFRAGDNLRARETWDRCIQLAQKLGVRSELAKDLRRKAELLLVTGDPSQALRLLRRAQGCASAAEPVEDASRHRVLGLVFARLGKGSEAEESFRSAILNLKDCGNDYELARAEFDLGRLLVEDLGRLRGNRREEGTALLEEAGRRFKRLEAIREADEVDHYLFRIDTGQDRRFLILKSIASLSTHRLPAPDFGSRCLSLLKEALGFHEAVFCLAEDLGRLRGKQFLGAGPFRWAGGISAEDILRASEGGELVMTPGSWFLPLRFSGKGAGVLYIHWLDPATREWDQQFVQTIANLVSVGLERSMEQTGPADVVSTRRRSGYYGIVGSTKAMREVFDQVDQVAPTNAPVLILGEHGTGKELIARVIHRQSARATGPFVTVSPAVIPATLLESELFGIESGTATGVAARIGKFEQAHQGTLFLDEIGDVDLSVQAKLLRVLQDQRFFRVGGNKTLEVDVRIIAATNQDLGQVARQGRFRDDLYYRLNVVTFQLPPLRKRQEDIPLLVSHFIKKSAEELGRSILGVAQDVTEILLRYHWPGNVRELANLIERATILCDSETIRVRDLPPHLQALVKKGTSLRGVSPFSREETLSTTDPVPGSGREMRGIRRQLQDEAGARLEREVAVKALEDSGGNVTEAAQRVGLSRAQFYRVIRKHKIARNLIPSPPRQQDTKNHELGTRN
jgi:DNA-binding NtrC family response regulator/tetratricopeptide (TPR) repeat protein